LKLKQNFSLKSIENNLFFYNTKIFFVRKILSQEFSFSKLECLSPFYLLVHIILSQNSYFLFAFIYLFLVSQFFMRTSNLFLFFCQKYWFFLIFRFKTVFVFLLFLFLTKIFIRFDFVSLNCKRKKFLNKDIDFAFALYFAFSMN
jgi:hypothetical protein